MNNIATELFAIRLQEFADIVKNPRNRKEIRVQFNQVARKTTRRADAAKLVMSKYGNNFDFEIIQTFTPVIDAQLKTSHPTRKHMDDAEKERVWKRQGCRCGNPHCSKSGGSILEYEWDHIIPFETAFDELGPMNMQVLCKECNQAKGSKIVPWAIEKFVARINEKKEKDKAKMIGADDIVFEQQSFFDNPDAPSQHVVL